MIGATVPRLGSCLAARWKHEEDGEGEEIDPCAQGDEDGVEEAGGQDVAVEVGDWALCEWSVCVLLTSKGRRRDDLIRTKPSERLVQSFILCLRTYSRQEQCKYVNCLKDEWR